MVTKSSSGGPRPYGYVQWPGNPDREQWFDYQLSNTSSDRMTDEFSLFGPEFIVNHVQHVTRGYDAEIPETESTAPYRLTGWVPDCMSVDATDNGKWRHLPVFDPKSGRTYISGNLDPSSGGVLATELCAQTNPGRAEVSLPAMLGESLGDLREMPGQILEKGRKAILGKRVDSVGAYFGVLPLVSDVWKLYHISGAIDKRSSELMGLYNKGGARRKRILFRGSHSVVASGEEARDRFGNGIVKVKTTATVWGVTHWLPGVDFNLFSDERGRVNRIAIQQQLLGMHPNKDVISWARDAWELLPWSWMADWCGNVGEYLEANGNSNLATYSDCYIMQQFETLRTFVGPHGTYAVKSVSKERVKSSPTLSVNAPFMTAQKMSILGGLAFRHRPIRSGGGGPTPGGDPGDSGPIDSDN